MLAFDTVQLDLFNRIPPASNENGGQRKPANSTGDTDLMLRATTAFELDAPCGNDYFAFTKRFNCWLTSARKSETQVFPTFLFAGCRRNAGRF